MNEINHDTSMNELRQQLERRESYLASDPANAELLASVIDLCLATGEHARAAHHLEAALALAPVNDHFVARQGALQLALRQWDAAEATFAALLARHADINLAYNLAYALQWQGRHGDAYAALAPWLAAPELSAPMVTLLVRALHHLGRGDEAIALAEQQMARCGADPVLLAAASLVCLDGERLELAGQWSQAALAARPGEAAPLEALVTAGSLALAHSDEQAAVGLFEQVLARDPAEGRSWSGLGAASLLRQDYAGAQRQLEQAVRYLPGHIGSWHLLAWSRILGGDLAGAQTAFQTALDLDRNFGESHGGMAVVHAMRGARAEAEAAIERAQRLDRDGLSAVYARMILDGATADPARFRQLARRLLGARQDGLGRNLGEVLDHYAAR